MSHSRDPTGDRPRASSAPPTRDGAHRGRDERGFLRLKTQLARSDLLLDSAAVFPTPQVFAGLLRRHIVRLRTDEPDRHEQPALESRADVLARRGNRCQARAGSPIVAKSKRPEPWAAGDADP